MSPNTCHRWIQLSDRRAVAEPLELEDLHFLDEHARACESCRAERTAWSLLGAALEDPTRLDQPALPKPAERDGALRLVEAARTRRRRQFAILGAAAAIALGAGAAFLTRSEAPVAAPVVSTARLALVSGDVEANARAATAKATLAANDSVRVKDGRACVALDPSVVTCLAEQSELRVARAGGAERALFLTGGHALAKLGPQPQGTTFQIDTVHGSVIAKGTVFAVDLRDVQNPTLRVHEGTVLVRRADGSERTLRAPVEAGLAAGAPTRPMTDAGLARDTALIGRASLLAPDASCELEVNATPVGARVTLDGQELGTAPLTALVAGGRRLAVEHPGFAPVSERFSFEAGVHVVRNYELVPLPPSAPAEVTAAEVAPETKAAAPGAEAATALTAAELLSRARTARAAGRYREAEGAYRRLVATYPKSPEAHASWVSLGELELSELGNPSAALRAFDAYLRGGGTLTQEARYGRIRALARLGRHADERRAIESFLRDYPSSVQASSLRQKLASP